MVDNDTRERLCLGNIFCCGPLTLIDNPLPRYEGTWAALVSFLNSLHADHLVLELAHRPASDLEALCDVDPRIGLGLGVVDVKVNRVETPEEIAGSLERAETVLGQGRVRFIHPDCGFWMLKRSVADRKIAALAKGRDLYLGRS